MRQARRTDEPDPVTAAAQAELAGAGAIICHLREDRRHVQDRDLHLLPKIVTTRLNLEMGLSDDIVRIAHEVRPHQVTFVPEKREELTTEGGLDVAGDLRRIADHTAAFRAEGVEVSHFIDAEEAQIKASREAGAQIVELHTGTYANAKGAAQQEELDRIRRATDQLTQSSHRLAEAMYQQTQASASPGPEPTEAETESMPSGGDNVVDAEFEDVDK